jgi:hypothetical protein
MTTIAKQRRTVNGRLRRRARLANAFHSDRGMLRMALQEARLFPLHPAVQYFHRIPYTTNYAFSPSVPSGTLPAILICIHSLQSSNHV